MLAGGGGIDGAPNNLGKVLNAASEFFVLESISFSLI